MVGAPRLVVYPMILNSHSVLLPGLRSPFPTKAPVGDWWAYVDASDGQILTRTNHVDTFDIPTTVKSDTQLNYAFDPQTEIPSPDHWVRANSTDFYTDADGFVNLTVPTTRTYTVRLDDPGALLPTVVTGPKGADASFSGPGTPGHAAAQSSGTTPTRGRGARRLLQRQPGPPVAEGARSGLHLHGLRADHQRQPRTDGTCNAYWNGSSDQLLQGRRRLREHGRRSPTSSCTSTATASRSTPTRRIRRRPPRAWARRSPTSSPRPSPTTSYIGRGTVNNGNGYIRNRREHAPVSRHRLRRRGALPGRDPHGLDVEDPRPT